MVWTCDEIRGNKYSKRWLNKIENDIRALGVCIEDVESRDE
jgi:hypothetical protein